MLSGHLTQQAESFPVTGRVSSLPCARCYTPMEAYTSNRWMKSEERGAHVSHPQPDSTPEEEPREEIQAHGLSFLHWEERTCHEVDKVSSRAHTSSGSLLCTDSPVSGRSSTPARVSPAFSNEVASYHVAAFLFPQQNTAHYGNVFKEHGHNFHTISVPYAFSSPSLLYSYFQQLQWSYFGFTPF